MTLGLRSPAWGRVVRPIDPPAQLFRARSFLGEGPAPGVLWRAEKGSLLGKIFLGGVEMYDWVQGHTAEELVVELNRVVGELGSGGKVEVLSVVFDAKGLVYTAFFLRR